MVVVNNYNINNIIGKGAYSTVCMGTNINDKSDIPIEYAIKIIKLNKLNDNIKNRIEIEVDILRKLNHTNIIKLYDSFYNDGILYIVLDKCKTDLHTELKTNYSKIDINTKINWIKQLTSGLLYLHHNKIMHRDIKPQNLLINYNNEIKIIDFGFARHFETENLMNTVCGSPLYMSPELFINRMYDYRTDYWSMGIIFYQIIVGTLPYNARNLVDLMTKLKNITDIKIPQNIADLYDKDIIHLIESMLIISTKYRISFDCFNNHPFIKKNFNQKYNNNNSFDDIMYNSFDDIMDLPLCDSVEFNSDNSLSESTEISSKSKPIEISNKSKPIEISNKSKPIEISSKSKPIEISSKTNLSYSTTSTDNTEHERNKLNESVVCDINNVIICKNYFSAPVIDNTTKKNIYNYNGKFNKF
jgi:non-specific serine/threonine protein kinase